MKSIKINPPMNNFTYKKILLVILPYWDPMIPPAGIASLKSFLQSHGYEVKNLDLIVKKESLDFYINYFNELKKCVLEEKRGNFNNIGHDVLQNHMMAHQNYRNENQYIELVKILVYNSYYVKISDSSVRRLNKIMDTFYTMLREYFLEVLKEEKPDGVGVTAYKCTLPASMFILKLTKEKYPHIKTFMGGGTFNETHAPDSPNFKALLEATKDYLDKIILGQGELLFLKYLRGELSESQRIYTKEDINGEFLDFPDLDIPDFSDFDIDKYPYLPATASSSCIYQCSFCIGSKVAGKYRVKDTAQTVAEMTKLYKKYNRQLFFMTDSLLNPIVTDLAREFIKSDIALYYDAYFRIDDASADINNTMLWRRGGLYRVRLGTESGSPKILKRMNKGITVEQIKTALSALAFAGIKTTTYWVIGHPGETEEDFQQTLDLIEEVKDNIFQAECNYFLVHYSMQTDSDEWRRDTRLLYPEWASHMLVFQYYTPGSIEPLREETFRRIHRFEAHCRKLQIPNPYSYSEHIKAEERWKKLHTNAVPSMLELIGSHSLTDECKKIKTIQNLREIKHDDGDFDFS
jgi:radical SAM superfamily enzyme YgiQ (UPF0313 family)